MKDRQTTANDGAAASAPKGPAQGVGDFRFYDNRQKYLLFVTTCDEKWVVAERIGREIAHLAPVPPCLSLFDAGMGDGTVLSHVLRYLHAAFPTVPFHVVGKDQGFARYLTEGLR